MLNAQLKRQQIKVHEKLCLVAVIQNLLDILFLKLSLTHVQFQAIQTMVDFAFLNQYKWSL